MTLKLDFLVPEEAYPQQGSPLQCFYHKADFSLNTKIVLLIYNLLLVQYAPSGCYAK